MNNVQYLLLFMILRDLSALLKESSHYVPCSKKDDEKVSDLSAFFPFFCFASD